MIISTSWEGGRNKFIFLIYEFKETDLMPVISNGKVQSAVKTLHLYLTAAKPCDCNCNNKGGGWKLSHYDQRQDQARLN